MHKIVRTAAALALCLALLLTASAETVTLTEEALLGDWQIQDGPGFTATFTDDGVLLLTDGTTKIEYQWALGDGILYLGATACIVDGDTLTLSISMPEAGLEESLTYGRRSGETDLLTGVWEYTDDYGIVYSMTFNEDGTASSTIQMGTTVFETLDFNWMIANGILLTGTEVTFTGDTLKLTLDSSEMTFYR